MYQKFNYWRSPSYLRWVASRPCIACGIEGFSQAAHSNQARHGKGKSIKASDEFTFPLCAPHWGMMGCHYMHDNCIDMSKAARDAIEDGYIARTLAEAAQFGWHEKRSA